MLSASKNLALIDSWLGFGGLNRRMQPELLVDFPPLDFDFEFEFLSFGISTGEIYIDPFE